MVRARLSLRPLWLALPLVLVAAFLVAGSRAQRPSSGAPPASIGAVPHHPANGRLVVVIVDSLRQATLEAPGMMPGLLALSKAPGVTKLRVETCASNFSLPCIQTIFSGRESPMAAGIEEFSGYGPSRRHLMDAAAASGLNVALAGNDMLPTLFGRHARERFSVAPLGLPALASDLAAVERTATWLRDPSIDLVVLHTAGTDHVTHYDLPGTPGYAAHFHAVDAAVTRVIGRLDLSRDSLVVMGDHGHDNDGHHVRHSLALLAGRRYEELFREIDVPGGAIDQKDLLYFLSFPALLPMSADYEGRYFGLARGRQADAHLAAFLDVQRRQLLAGWPHPGDGTMEQAVAARMSPDWRPGNERAWTSLLGALPLLSCLLLWIVWVHGAGSEERLSARPAVACALLAAATWALQRASIVPPAVLVLAPLALIGWRAWRRGSWRVELVAAVLIAGAAGTSAIEPAWRSFFHSRDEFHWGIPVFYLLMLGAGAVLAWLRGGGLGRWPASTQLAAFIALPAGVYYYQFNENLLRAYLIPAALLLCWHGARRAWRRARPADAGRGHEPGLRLPDAGRWPVAVALGVTALLLVPQDAGGWQWHSWLAGRLRPVPAAWSFAVYGVAALWLVALLRTWRRRLLLAFLLLPLPFYVVGFAGLEAPRMAAAFLIVLFVAAWLAVLEASGPSPTDDETAGLMLAASAVAISLTTCDGFLIDHVDFTFALQFTTSLRTDAGRFLVVAPLVALKYAAPLLALFVVHRLLRGAAATSRALGFMLLFLTLKVLALLVQVLVGALDVGEKFFELAQTDFLFVGCLIIVVAMWTFAIWVPDAIAALVRVREADDKEAPGTSVAATR